MTSIKDVVNAAKARAKADALFSALDEHGKSSATALAKVAAESSPKRRGRKRGQNKAKKVKASVPERSSVHESRSPLPKIAMPSKRRHISVDEDD